MNKMIERIKVACQSGAVTALICLAQPAPSFASDIELYKAPQVSEPTLMFMLDVSGSMGSYDNTSETRLTRLRNGMYKLLQGDSSQGIEPLPGNLSAGLSDFDGINGRIRLEALPLNTLVDIPGTRQIYRRTEQLNQPVSCTTTATQDTTATQQRSQTRTQTRERKRDRTRTRNNTNKPWSSWGDWSDWSSWEAPVSSAASGWSNETNVGQPSQGGWVGGGACNNFTATGSASVTSSTLEKCTAWASDNTTCTTWGAAATSQLTGTASTPVVIPGNNSSNVRTQQGTSQAVPIASLPAPPAWSPTSPSWNNAPSWTPASPTDTDPAPQSEIVTSSNEKRQTETQTQTQTQIQSQTQTRTAVTARNSREDTTTATRTDSQVTIYSGTATTTHRQRMIDAVRALRGGGNTPTAFAYAEVAAYMMGQTTKDLTSSGFSASDGKEAIQNGSRYIAPARVTSSKQCNKQGIYFLTDGEPVYSNNPGNYTTFMSSTLGAKASSFGCTTNQLVSTGNSWGCIGNYAKALLDPTKNPAGVSIKTAVVGFGSDFGDGVKGSSDVENAKKWGEVGQGGWYSGASALDVVNSVKAFLKKLDQYIPSVTTGSVTIPVDALDTQNVQPWAYYPQFDPKPSDSTTGVITWFGNVKKYKTLNNSLVDRNNASITNSNGLLEDDINDFWANTSITKKIVKIVNDVEVEYTVKVGGALSQMILGYNANATPAERRIFTDRKYIVDPNDATKNIVDLVASGQDLKKIGKADFLSTSTNQFKEDPKRGYLLSLYGYAIPKDLAVNLSLYPKDSVYQTSLEQSLTATPGRDWLMGAVMHSKPILLTQEGTTKYANDVLTYDNRDDLILYGTTQGVLHVVKAGKNADDSNAGKELFAFVPNEMIENQAEGFLSQASQSGTLKYGIDGQWTAYTEYVTKKGTAATDEPVITVKGGKQWVYGGLRMGGKSYYALDLTDVSSSDNSSVPKIKFRIDPASATSGPLSYMGQSWSKPTIGSVNWKGKRKLVMFVGGGYDMGYETDNYAQSNGIGAGIYMFDANNGDLLWWASSNATDTNSSATGQAKNVANMSYSVVSQIKTVDRNSDGLIDHLYFGDLGGQLWRIDLNNTLSTSSTSAFATNAVRLLNLHADNGTSPRFYTTPSFTIHNGGGSGLFAALSIGSGDLSSPMSAAGANGKDAVYVVFDKDVTKSNLYRLAESDLTSKNIVKGTTGNTLASNTDGKTKTDLTRGGWYAPLNSKYRVLNDTVAVDNDLYISVFDANQDIAASCEGGVRGKSDVYQFCLPYGQCTETVAGVVTPKNPPASIFLGKGNIGIAFGGTTGESSTNRSLVLNVPKPSGTTLPNYGGKLKFVSQRWYEKFARAN